jgi:hypothetical protein
VVDGLLYHESDFLIDEHCSDTVGFTALLITTGLEAH